MHARLTRRSTLFALMGGLSMIATARAQQAAPAAAQSESLVINNVAVFDGVRDQLRRGSVLITDRKIVRISSDALDGPSGSTVLDGGGRVLMPGLTDAHWHMVFAPNTMANMEAADTGLMYANTVAEAERTLLRGFTTVRDIAGPAFGIKAAIDAGVVPGPRVYPSGALISQTAGHGDFAPLYEPPTTIGGRPSHLEEIGAFTVANGVPQVLAAVRNQLKKGASQIKIAIGGGVISESDPIDTLQFTPEEVAAAVQAASDWGTYVAAHVYTVAGIRRAIDAGVRSIEHGHMVDEATMGLMAEKGVWLSLQPFEAGDNPLTPEQIAKAEPTSHWDRVAGWAKQYGVRLAFGTDLLFQPDGTYKQNEFLTRLSKVYTPTEVLKIATSGNAELFALSGERNPYKEAKLGVVEEGAWADLLLVEGDPTKDINVLKDYERNLILIIKDGRLYKNALN